VRTEEEIVKRVKYLQNRFDEANLEHSSEMGNEDPNPEYLKYMANWVQRYQDRLEEIRWVLGEDWAKIRNLADE
jgi:hypothetical protein